MFQDVSADKGEASQHPWASTERSVHGMAAGVDKRRAGLVSVVWKVCIEAWGRDDSRQSLRVRGQEAEAVRRPERLAERWAVGRRRGQGEERNEAGETWAWDHVCAHALSGPEQ